MDKPIITPHHGWVQISLNRPTVKNALNTEALACIAAALDRADQDPSVNAALIHGRGGNFAAGADIGEIESKTSAEARLDPRKDHWAKIRGFSKPLVAAVDGFALGGGFELALMADLMVVDANAKLGLPETNLGLIPGAGGTQRLLALAGRARAGRMILTGEMIDGDTAFGWGIAGYLSHGAVFDDAVDLTRRIVRRAPLALQAAKSALVTGDEAQRAFALERSGFEALMDSADKIEGIRAFRDKRKPEFKGQ